MELDKNPWCLPQECLCHKWCDSRCNCWLRDRTRIAVMMCLACKRTHPFIRKLLLQKKEEDRCRTCERNELWHFYLFAISRKWHIPEVRCFCYWIRSAAINVLILPGDFCREIVACAVTMMANHRRLFFSLHIPPTSSSSPFRSLVIGWLT